MYSSQESLQMQCNLLLKDSVSQNKTFAELLKFTHMCINFRSKSVTALTLKIVLSSVMGHHVPIELQGM
jgi:hypothetical protein